jgi:hypothetical protein
MKVGRFIFEYQPVGEHNRMGEAISGSVCRSNQKPAYDAVKWPSLFH